MVLMAAASMILDASGMAHLRRILIRQAQTLVEPNFAVLLWPGFAWCAALIQPFLRDKCVHLLIFLLLYINYII